MAVAAQLLSAPRPRSILEVVEGLGSVQMDPTRRVARTEHLVFWSRLGRRFRVAELERLLWRDRSLFEYRAFILPTSQYPVHRQTMRRYPSGSGGRREYVRRYLRENQAFRRYILARLRAEGPLQTRAFEDRSAVGWRTGGWNDDGKNTSMMLEVLWAKGEVMIAGRAGQERVWDLAERRLPLDETRLAPGEEARRLLETQLRALGIAKLPGFGKTFEGNRPPGWERALGRARARRASGPGARRRAPGGAMGARRCAGPVVPAEDRAPLAVRSLDPRPGAVGGALRVPVPTRDLRPEGRSGSSDTS